MKAALILALLALTTTTCLAGLCNHPNIWNCQGNVATLKSIPEKNDNAILQFKTNFVFETKENIRKVVISLEETVNVYKISGPDIEEIEVSGGDKKIESLCNFLNATPKLEKVVIHDTNVMYFQGTQECTNVSTGQLDKVEVIISHDFFFYIHF